MIEVKCLHCQKYYKYTDDGYKCSACSEQFKKVLDSITQKVTGSVKRSGEK